MVIVAPIVLVQLAAEYSRQAAKRRAERAAEAERRWRARLERRGQELRTEVAQMMAEISAFAQSTVGKHVEGDLQSIIARLRVLGKNVLREEDEISDVAKQLKRLRKLFGGATTQAEASQLTTEVGQHQAILLQIKREAASSRLLSLKFDPDGLHDVEATMTLVESHLKRRNLTKAQQEMAHLQELCARHRALVDREQDRWNGLQEEAVIALAGARERLATLQADEVVRRWRVSDLEVLVHRVEELESSVPAGRFAEIHRQCESLCAEADKVVAAAEEMQRCQEQRDYVARSIVESLAEVGFWVEQVPAKQASADATIRATCPDGRALTVSVPLEGSLRWMPEGFPMEVFNTNNGQPARGCDEAVKQIEAVKAYLSERHGIQTSELNWNGKTPDRLGTTAKRLPHSDAHCAQQTREART